MSNTLNPPTRMTARLQGGLYYARKNRRGRATLDSLTAWSAGLPVTAGQYVRNAGNGYQAVNSGTTGSTPPTVGGGNQSDGTVTWTYVAPEIFNNLNAPGTPT